MIKRMCMALSVLIVAMTLTMPTTFAANWKWVYSDDKHGFYFDTETASKTGGTVFAWLKARNLDGSFYLVHEKIWNKGWTHSIGTLQEHDAKGNNRKYVDERFRRSFEIAPGTAGAYIYPVIWRWTMRNGQDM